MSPGLPSDEPMKIAVETTVKAGVKRVWDLWTLPRHITQWNQASDDWHTTRAENDLRPGGKFSYRMEARDGSAGFDFRGVYEKIEPTTLITSTLGDGRKVSVSFMRWGDDTVISETFEAEKTNQPELQRRGWQAILDNFKKYAEGLKKQ
jgi:uncharacterized protein YndB with AHSA1/START domain